LIYFITLELCLFCALCIAAALIYSYKGGILASFLSSAVAVRLYPLIILQRQAVWTFWSGLRSDLGGPFSVSPMAQILDPYVMVGRTTAIYSRRDLWKYCFITTLILTYFNTNLKYIIKINLSNYTLGGVLLQYNKNGELYLVAFLF